MFLDYFLSLLSLVFLLNTRSSSALKIPLHRRDDPPHSTTVKMGTVNNGSFGFENYGDMFYLGTIEVSGQPFMVEIDTGSSDLWLDTSKASLTTSDVHDTGVPGSITYTDSTGAFGNIFQADVTWGDFTVQGQAFINAPGSNATRGGQKDGLIGVGPTLLSTINTTLVEADSNANGATFLDNVFAYYPNEPNFITFLLSRSDTGVIDGGSFTIGELASGYENVQSQPQLPAVSSSRWNTYMDGIKVNGQFYNGGSRDPSNSNNQTVAMLDTGTTYILSTKPNVDLLYSNVPGAQLDNDNGVYLLPCDSIVNISLVFAGYEYPIHPIDAVVPAGLNNDGSVYCQSGFSYVPDGGVDFLLGDTFLRNVYSLFDFGTFTPVGTTTPFMQLLSLTDADQAAAEYAALNQARLEVINQALSNMTHSSSSTFSHDNSGDDSTSGALESDSLPSPSSQSQTLLQNSYIIIGLLGGAVLLLLILLGKSCLQGHAIGGGSRGKYEKVGKTKGKKELLMGEEYSLPYSDHDRERSH